MASAVWMLGACASDIQSEAADSLPEAQVAEQALASSAAINADAYVRDGKSAAQNFGASTILAVKSSSNANNARRAYLRVDLSHASGSVSSARLRLFGHYLVDAGAPGIAVALRSVANNDWQESQLTSSNAPAIGAELAATTVNGTSAVYEWDVTSFVAAQVASHSKSVSFALVAKASSDARLEFNAREAPSNAPQFVLSITPPTPAPAPTPTPTPAPTPTPTPAPPPTTTVWRPFSANSPWNSPIAANPRIDAQSDAMITDWNTASPFGSYLGINIDNYSVPLYLADASTPLRQVTANIGGEGFSGNNGFNATALVPIPGDAAPDPQSDRHMLIVDRAHSLEWGFFGASLQGNQWTCKLCASSNLNGTGVRPVQATNPTWYTSHGPRACGFPLVAGLIRTEEIEAGVIDHALVVAYPHIRAGLYTPPASTAQAHVGSDAIKTRGIPCGGRVQLDPTLNLDALGLSRSGKIIARALQVYGAYVGDYSGSMSLYAENAPAALAYWRGGKLGTTELRNKVDLRSFRVLELGTLLDDGNGD